MQKWVAIPFRLSKEEYTALSKEARAKRKLRTMHITWDILRSNGEDCKSAEEDHAFIEEARARLIVPFLKGAKWGGGKQAHLNWHLKAGPHRFYPALAMMAKEVAGSGAEHIAIFPLKRKGAPGFVHLDSFGLHKLLKSELPANVSEAGLPPHAKDGEGLPGGDHDRSIHQQDVPRLPGRE